MEIHSDKPIILTTIDQLHILPTDLFNTSFMLDHLQANPIEVVISSVGRIAKVFVNRPNEISTFLVTERASVSLRRSIETRAYAKYHHLTLTRTSGQAFRFWLDPSTGQQELAEFKKYPIVVVFSQDNKFTIACPSMWNIVRNEIDNRVVTRNSDDKARVAMYFLQQARLDLPSTTFSELMKRAQNRVAQKG